MRKWDGKSVGHYITAVLQWAVIIVVKGGSLERVSEIYQKS